MTHEMNAIFKSKSTRLLSALLSVLMIFAILPTTAFAWSAEEGTQCTSAYGDKYLGSDGDYFYSKPTTTAIIYNEDGSFHVETREIKLNTIVKQIQMSSKFKILTCLWFIGNSILDVFELINLGCIRSLVPHLRVPT